MSIRRADLFSFDIFESYILLDNIKQAIANLINMGHSEKIIYTKTIILTFDHFKQEIILKNMFVHVICTR